MPCLALTVLTAHAQDLPQARGETTINFLSDDAMQNIEGGLITEAHRQYASYYRGKPGQMQIGAITNQFRARAITVTKGNAQKLNLVNRVVNYALEPNSPDFKLVVLKNVAYLEALEPTSFNGRIWTAGTKIFANGTVQVAAPVFGDGGGGCSAVANGIPDFRRRC